MTATAFVIPAPLDTPARVIRWDEPAELLPLLHGELAAEELSESDAFPTPYGPIVIWSDANALTRAHGSLPANQRAQAVADAHGARGMLAGTVVLTGGRGEPWPGEHRGLSLAHLMALMGVMDEVAKNARAYAIRDAIRDAIGARDRDRIDELIGEMFAVSQASGMAAVTALVAVAPDLLPDRWRR